MALLEIRNLTFSYPECNEYAIENINFSVSEGEFLVVCGKSGCGKTTLLKLIKKQLAPYGTLNGHIFFEGADINDSSAKSSAFRIGFIMQNPDTQIVTDSVWQELSFGLENLGMPSEIIRRRVSETASYFGIEKWFHKKTAELSGGQKQLLNLASVISMYPKMLILDEPTAQLDPISSANFINTLKKLNEELGITVIIAEHNLEEVLFISDKVVLLNDGRQEFTGNKREFASYLIKNKNHPLYNALPSSARIFGELKENGECPLNVKEGRKFILENYKNDINSITYPPYTHSNEKTVEIKEAYFRYGKDLPDILEETDLSVYKGEHFCVLGGNGCGKSTLLNVIAGISRPYSGKVIIKGKNISKYKGNSLYRNNISLLPQNPELLFLHNTVSEDLNEISDLNGYSKEGKNTRIEKLSEDFGIKHLLNRHPYDLSGGELQKAALVKLLLTNPEILLLDEPTKAIDVSNKEYICEVIKELNKKGITVITVTHDIEFAAACADRCGLFFDGKIVSADTPFEFFSENSLYTTAACRISKGYFKNSVLCSQVSELCRQNKGGKDV